MKWGGGGGGHDQGEAWQGEGNEGEGGEVRAGGGIQGSGFIVLYIQNSTCTTGGGGERVGRGGAGQPAYSQLVSGLD